MIRLAPTVALFACFFAFFECSNAFVGTGPKTSGPRSSLIQLNVIPPEILEEAEGSRIQFIIWFFGASGAASIARSAFPTMYDRMSYINSLKGEGPTLGGETIGVSPLCGYPEDISVKDVEKVVNNRMPIEQMVKKFPEEDNYLASKGYVTFSAFQQANSGANPLAVRAVFDTFSQSNNLSEPRVAQGKLDAYKEDVYNIKGGLIKSKITGVATVVTLLFLLGYADITAWGHARDGWFHYWKLSDGLQNIPDFWI